MGQSCCSGGLGNLGYQSEALAGPTIGGFLQQRTANDGTTNGFSSALTSITSVALNALINHPDPSKRIYPVKVLRDFITTQGDPQTQSFADGQSGITGKGIKSVTAFITGQGGAYIEKLQTHGCEDMNFYPIDVCGGFEIQLDRGNSLLTGIPIFADSWKTDRVAAVANATVAGINIAFEYDVLLTVDALHRYIGNSFIESNLKTIMGLLDVIAVISDQTATGFKATLTTAFGSVLSAIKVVGWVTADFVLNNKTTPGAIVITSATETEAGVSGVYDFVIPTTTVTDTLELTDDMDGFELIKQFTLTP